MKLGPLVTGTLIAICLFVGSFFWVGANQVPPGNRLENNVPNQMHHDLLVTFRGEMPKEGQLVIQLYSTASSFDQRQQPFDECFLKLDISDEALWEFKNIPAGIYAIAVLHDRNENGKYDSGGDSGREKVGYSVSHLPSPLNPDFESCTFQLNKRTAIEIELY